MENSENSEPTHSQSNLLGDPNCPICKGIGFTRQDLPIDHPDFGRLQTCSCRQQAISQSTHDHLFRLSNLKAFQNMTFDTFNPQGRMGLGDDQIKSLKYTYNQALHFANDLRGWLFLMGGYGVGKTHLAAAIANHAVGLGVPTLFLTVPDLLDWLRFNFNNSEVSYQERFEEIRSIHLLVLDDLGTQNTTPWAQEKLYQILNYRYSNQLPVVLTTNLNLEQIEERIRSRLQDPDLVTKVKINAEDYRNPIKDTSHPKISSLQVHSGQTFGNFSLREHEKLPSIDQKSLEKAFYAAQQFAENPNGWLVLMGTYGTGKTHLAAAIGNYRHALGDSPMFVVVPDLLDHLRATFSPDSIIPYDQLFYSIRSSPLLILDDLGTQSPKPWAQEKLYQIFNHRYNARLPTVITTAFSLEEIDPRIRSRIMDEQLCKLHKILVQPYHIKTIGAESKRKKRRSPSK